jgi:hypothetical protein
VLCDEANLLVRFYHANAVNFERWWIGVGSFRRKDMEWLGKTPSFMELGDLPAEQ